MKKIIWTALTGLCFVFSTAGAQARAVTYEELRRTYVAQPSPEGSFRLEMELLRKGMYCHDLPLFDPEWRAKGREIVYSGVYAQTAAAFDAPFRVIRQGDYAAVYFPDDPQLGPVFLYWERSGWVIDRSEVLSSIIYDNANTAWYCADNDSPYLALLKKAFSLKKVKLSSGIVAYTRD